MTDQNILNTEPGANTSDTVSLNTLDVGIVWRDADALAQACMESGRDQIVVVDKQGSVGVWNTGTQCWHVTAPHTDFAPYRIIHTGRRTRRWS